MNSRSDITWRDDQFLDDANTDSERAEDFIVVDLKFWKEIGDALRLSLTVENLFDNAHTVTPSGKDAVAGIDRSLESFNPGRVVTGSLTWRF